MLLRRWRAGGFLMAGFFVVFLGGLGFLSRGFFGGRFVVLFSRLRFLNWRFLRVMFFHVSGFSRGCGGGGRRRGRSSRGSGSVSSEGNRRQTHCSGNNQS